MDNPNYLDELIEEEENNYQEDKLLEQPEQERNNVTVFDVVNDFNERILNLKTQLKKARKSRYSFLIIGGFFVTPIILKYASIIKLNLFVEVILWILSILFLMVFIADTKVEEYNQEIENIEYKKTTFYQFAGLEQPKTYFESLVNINIENLGDYYSLVKIHTNRSFKTSLICSISGFLLIIAGLAFTYIEPRFQNISYIISSSGVVVEMISGLFFYLYNKTVRQLKEYHDSLLDVQNILLSFKLIEGIQNFDDQSDIAKSMIQFLVSRNSKLQNT